MNLLKKEKISETAKYLNHESKYFNHTINLALDDLRLIEHTLNGNITNQNSNSILDNLFIDKNRFLGFYLYDTNGTLISKSNDNIFNRIPLTAEKTSFKSALKSKVITSSEVITNVLYEEKYIRINLPILDSNSNVNYVLIGLLKYDFIENIGLSVIDSKSFKLLSNNDIAIFETNYKVDYNQEHCQVLKLEHLGWKIALETPKTTPKEIIHFIIPFQAIFLFFTSTLFIAYCFFKYRDINNNYIELINSQKLELVGQLAAGTAHEIRNPLTGIKGLVSLISEKHKDDPEDQFYAKVIQDEITRINQIVSEFMILGKPTAEITNTFDLNEILKEVEPVIRSEAYLKNIDYIHSNYDEYLPISCSKDHIKQVILNLSKNAIDAMDNGGLLTIICSKDTKHIEIKIIDNGCGIEEDKLKEIFQPFFTTKDTGTGLGLIVCHRLIESYSGTISFESIVNEGTTVTIKLPHAIY
jgi:two-component system, sporulation sensor kinase D